MYLSFPRVHIPVFKWNMAFKIPRPTGPASFLSGQLHTVAAIYLHMFRSFTFCLMRPVAWAPAIGIGAQRRQTSHANKQNITSAWARRAGLAGPAASPRPRPGAFLGRGASVLRARGCHGAHDTRGARLWRLSFRNFRSRAFKTPQGNHQG